jgi:hypothetical protein
MNFFKSLIIISMLSATPALATTLFYNFDSPTGQLNTSQQYFSDGILITAYGYSHGDPDDLYGKNNGGDESGLGLMGDSDHEIQDNSFVQLNLTNLWVLHPESVQMSIGSVQSGESWEIYGSNKLGTLGTKIQSGDLDAPSTFTLTSTAENYKYIDVEAMCGDVLLSTLSANVPVECVPEPGSLALMGAGLIGMASFLSKLRG